MKEWVKMPSNWLRNDDLRPLGTMKWIGPQKADQIAALMLYIVLLHHANDKITTVTQELGIVNLTYNQLSDITGLSRAKISGGLKILSRLNIISNISTGRNNIYQIKNFDTHSGWAKLPAQGLYSRNLQKINAFQHFTLRSKIELNALKLYLVITAFRNNSTNYAELGYDRINKYTGMSRNEIRPALSLLINLRLIHVESSKSSINEFSTINMYRLCYLEAYKHRGTSSRAHDSQFAEAPVN